MALSIEGDGLVENLYHFLWSKDTLYTSGPAVLIPHTIVYRYQQPSFWYFSSLQEGTVKRKNSSKLNNAEIEAEFKKKKNKADDLLCQYMYVNPTTKQTIVEFFTADDLHHFLYSRQKPYNGVLQKFIYPKGDFNQVIRCIWSPKICLFERKQNIKPLNDLRFDSYERAVTFEGEEFHCQSLPVRGLMLPQSMQNIANQIVKHIASVTYDKCKITRMVLNFKIDSKDNLWLLYASSIRLKGDKVKRTKEVPLDLGEQQFTVPDTVNIKSKSNDKPKKMKREVFCRNCERAMEIERMFEIPYKFIIAEALDMPANSQTSMVKVLQPSQEINNTNPIFLKSKNSFIPKILQVLHPRLKEKDFIKYMKDPLFLNKTTHVCEECYLSASTTSYCGGAKEKPAKEDENLVGRQMLQPERTARRRELTMMQTDRPQTNKPQISIRETPVHSGPTSAGGLITRRIPTWDTYRQMQQEFSDKLPQLTSREVIQSRDSLGSRFQVCMQIYNQNRVQTTKARGGSLVSDKTPTAKPTRRQHIRNQYKLGENELVSQTERMNL